MGHFSFFSTVGVASDLYSSAKLCCSSLHTACSVDCGARVGNLLQIGVGHANFGGKIVKLTFVETNVILFCL